MEFKGYGLLGTLGIVFIALLIIGWMLHEPVYHVFAAIDFIVLVLVGLFGAKGGMSITKFR